MNTEEIIYRCQQNERRAQNELFQHYAPLMYSICLRYMKNRTDAEDVMVQGFFRVFDKINTYKSEGSFEGWMKRIIVNECLMTLRKRKSMGMTVVIDDVQNDISIPWMDDLGYDELIALLDELPDGYRTVFNLYAIEGYKHREIAELLDISINTSKSQLILARRKLQTLFKKKSQIKTA